MKSRTLVVLLAACMSDAAKKEPLSVRVNRSFDDLYDKADKLQDRTYKRVYQLQQRAEELQTSALQKAIELTKRAEAMQEKATRQAQELQREAAAQLGELQAAIEKLPIPPPPPRKAPHPEQQDAQEMPQVVDISTLKEDMSTLKDEVVDVITQEAEEVVAIVKSKWDNVRERTVPAILMLGGLTAYVRVGGSMVALIFLLQVGLYAETTSVAEITGLDKWWWFAAAIMATNGQFLEFKYAQEAAYGMGVVGLVAWIVQQNRIAAGTKLLAANLATLASTHMSLLFLVGQSSFWIGTLQNYGLTWILYPALLVIINDTMAYVFGMLMGKHALLPTISPKKTWEGFLGATACTMAVSQPLLNYMAKDTSIHNALAVGTFISLVSPFGGFLASVVKRAHEKKDFATYIPGHGGVVDRLDCQVMTAPFIYFYLRHFMKK